MILNGRVWKYGDDLGATDLVSAKYDNHGMSREWDKCAEHLLEEIDPRFASQVQSGDLIVAGQNLGAGHAHYYMAAIMGSAAAGVGALLGESVSALFFRAAIDAGVTAWAFPGIHDFADDGDRIEIDLVTGAATNHTQNTKRTFPPVSPIVREILDAGGSEPWALRKVAEKATAE
jgi:3-isopropylmalate/(R)-2-methylmalate dehydratase small subunit